MKEINVFEVTTNTDLNEWRWREVLVWYFWNNNLAELVADGKGVQSTSAYIKEKVLKIFDTPEEYLNSGWEIKSITNRIRAEALSKLTPLEIKTLGIELSYFEK